MKGAEPFTDEAALPAGRKAKGRGRRLVPGWPYLLVGAVFTVLHLTFQVFALLQSYRAGMAHFDDPLSRQADWESAFWEKATTVVTFPLVRFWEHLPAPVRGNSVVEWAFLGANSLIWGAAVVIFIRWAAGLFGEGEE